jgi:hypothetical protein
MAEEMVTVMVDGGDAPVAEPIYAGDDFQVFVDDEGAAKPDEATQALLDDLKAKQAELLAAQARTDPVAAMSAGIAALGDRIAPKAAPDVTVRPAQIDIAKLKEEFNKTLYDDPFEKTVDLIQKMQNFSGAGQANANLAYSRRILMVDPATKDLFKRFEGEVETEVAKMPAQERATNPGVYDDALLRVKARHMDELFEERLAEATKKAVAEAGGGAGLRPAPTSFSEAGSARVPSTVPLGTASREVRITASKKAEIEAFASDHIIPFSAALSLYERRGLLK